MNVSAVIVTRGDVDLTPVLSSLPEGWERIVWDNGANRLDRWSDGKLSHFDVSDLSVYGRYAAIEYASGDLIYVQDDDCVVSDPRAIVDALLEAGAPPHGHVNPSAVVCNMPPEFRHEFYTEHALVGFGACFHRDAPARAFQRASWWPGSLSDDMGFFYRTCDIVFTALTPRVLVDVPKTNLWWAENHTRMWRQEKHIEERTRMLELVKKVRDA